MSVTANVSLAAVSSARRYVMKVLLLLVLLTLADRPSIVLWMTSHPDITRSFPSYNTLQRDTFIYKLIGLVNFYVRLGQLGA